MSYELRALHFIKKRHIQLNEHEFLLTARNSWLKASLRISPNLALLADFPIFGLLRMCLEYIHEAVRDRNRTFQT
jgi:hypothetical protein